MLPRIEIRFPLRYQWRYCFGKPYEPTEGEFLLNHARTGIILALKALNLPSGVAVGVMTYNCKSVFNAVHQAGYKIVFIDVTHNLTIDMGDLGKKRPQISALIVTHLFDIENDIAAIRSQYPDLPIIEDCAHACGKVDIEGDMAVFSIGQGKLPSIGNGGILRVKNSDYVLKIQELYAQLSDYTFLQSVKLFVTLLMRTLVSLPLLYGITLRLKQNRKSPGLEPITEKKMCRGISAIYATERSKIGELIGQRSAKAKERTEEIQHSENVRRIMSGKNVFMLIADCENPKLLQGQLRHKGIDSATHFANCINWAKEFGYQDGACPNAEYLIQHLLMIPTYK